MDLELTTDEAQQADRQGQRERKISGSGDPSRSRMISCPDYGFNSLFTFSITCMHNSHLSSSGDRW